MYIYEIEVVGRTEAGKEVKGVVLIESNDTLAALNLAITRTNWDDIVKISAEIKRQTSTNWTSVVGVPA